MALTRWLLDGSYLDMSGKVYLCQWTCLNSWCKTDTDCNCTLTSLAFFKYLFIHLCRGEKPHSIWALCPLHIARDVMRYLYHLKCILLVPQLWVENIQNLQANHWKIWIHITPKQHMACGIHWAFINLYICGSSYLHQVRQTGRVFRQRGKWILFWVEKLCSDSSEPQIECHVEVEL